MLTWLFESLPKLINTLLVINFAILVRQYFAISIGNYEKKTSSYHYFIKESELFTISFWDNSLSLDAKSWQIFLGKTPATRLTRKSRVGLKKQGIVSFVKAPAF